MSSCLDYKSKELIELAKDVGVESTPAFADKVGTLMDSLQMEDESILPTLEQYNQYISDNKPKEIGKVDKPQGLMYAQCRLPALWKELFDDPFWINKDGDIDFDKVDEFLPEILDMLGYRIPNEDKYSSLPLKVNGFLPSGSGGAIMLPAEITTISGSDFDIDHMYAIIKHLTKSAGKLQVEKYLDDTNSTSQERKLAYTNRLPEAQKVRLSYKDRLQTIKDEISQAKIDNNDLKELKLKSKDLAEQWNDIQDEIESLDTPTPITVGMYKVIGITDLEAYKDGLKKEFEAIKKEYKAVNTQISELQAKGTVESEHVGTPKLQSLYNQKAELYTQRQEEINNLISDEEFNKLSIPQQNTKGARDNERLDIFTGIYTNPYTAKDIMSPGGYETIRKIASNINKNKSVPKDVFGMESMDALTIQNIQGRNLKGIAANHNSHASKRQYSNLKLSFPVLFDGKVLDSLNGTISESVSGEKKNITRNFAEILAASVDNGKDPLLASINYNQHTADVISLLLATGADMETVFAFVNQPIILKAVELVNLGEQRDLLTALKSIAKEMKVSSQFKDIEITNFNQKELVDMFNGSDNSVSQGKVLQNMIKYMIASKDFSNLIAASKSDTKGIGKFMEEGITLIRNIKKALTLKTITGTQEFLLNDEKGTEELTDQRFNNMFYKYGVKMPIDEVMSKIYPYINESFSGVKDIIEQQLGYSLTADEAKLVDQMLVQFHTSKFDWYANEDKNNIVKNLPNVITALKADYSEFVQSDLVKPLFNALVVGKDISMGMNSITFDNTQTASDEQREDIKKAWASLSKPYAEQLLTERLLKDNLLTPEELVTLQLDGKSFNNLKAIQLFKKQDKFQNDYIGENNVKPSGTINVYWGNPESTTSTRILSNLAPRKFTYEGREYGSVEHAYQSNKNGKFDEVTYNSYIAKGGYGVKIAPKLTEQGKVGSLQLMKNLVVESFRQNQNSEAAKKLLQYENFTHNTNELIDKAFLEGLKLAQSKLLAKVNSQSVKSDGVSIQQLIQDYLFDRFANNLIRYSFFTTGLNFTPKSISGLIPISTYSNISYNGTSMTDLIYNIQNIGNIGTQVQTDENGIESTYAEIGSDAESFIDQFYKHMYNNQKFVPQVSYSQYDKTGNNNVTTVNDQQITIVPKETTNSELYEYKDDYLVAKNDYISVKTDGKFKLYKNVSSGSNGYLTFERVELLGVPKLVYEFDANNTGQSIIPGNNIEAISDEVAVPSKEEIEQRKEECK